ncbi:DUF5615 family PIN-like protein [Luteolibacter sp. Populi]|uniref:DUF5615 family PIN-like protein n=1 Tax=Luteolibacter sp. Populi TaxID=3230487 RepID=UPI0034651C55
MARFYSNENFPLPVVLALRELGHDVLTSFEAGNANREIPDQEVLLYAVSTERAVLTLNRHDFVMLHRASPAHAGIVVCTFDPDFPAQARRIHAAVTSLADLAGHLLRVNRAS